MERFTTDHPQNNTEMLLNLAYAKNNWVHIRSMEKPFMGYVQEQCRAHGCNLSELSDGELCDAVFDCGFSSPECPVFLLYAIATQSAELRERLKAYEDTGKTPEEVTAWARAHESI